MCIHSCSPRGAAQSVQVRARRKLRCSHPLSAAPCIRFSYITTACSCSAPTSSLPASTSQAVPAHAALPHAACCWFLPRRALAVVIRVVCNKSVALMCILAHRVSTAVSYEWLRLHKCYEGNDGESRCMWSSFILTNPFTLREEKQESMNSALLHIAAWDSLQHGGQWSPTGCSTTGNVILMLPETASK